MMAMVHVYIGMVNINLSSAQKQQLVQALRAISANSNPQPCNRNHWRTRLDNDAVIFEALWNEDHISVAAVKVLLGTIFGVNPSTITHSVVQQTFGVLPTAIVTFVRGGTNYLRMAYFGYSGGGLYPTWEQSRLEAVAYIKANIAAWEGAQ